MYIWHMKDYVCYWVRKQHYESIFQLDVCDFLFKQFEGIDLHFSILIDNEWERTPRQRPAENYKLCSISQNVDGGVVFEILVVSEGKRQISGGVCIGQEIDWWYAIRDGFKLKSRKIKDKSDLEGEDFKGFINLLR